MKTFQLRVLIWVCDCFGVEVAHHQQERCTRFAEESVELLQSLDFPKEKMLEIVDYVYSRDKGRDDQELGGVMVTLAALSSAISLDMDKCGEVELERVLGKVEQIRLKHNNKPEHLRLKTEK